MNSAASSAPATPPGIGVAPFDLAFYQDMHARLDAVRAREPVHYIRQLHTWCTTRFVESHSVLRDPRFVKRGWVEMIDASLGGGTVLLDLMSCADPPDHIRLRRFARRAFSSDVFAGLGAVALTAVDDRIAELRKAGGGDLVSDVARRVPMPVVGALLDVPRADIASLEEWAQDLFRAAGMGCSGDLTAGHRALGEMYAYFTGHVRVCLARGEGLVAALAATVLDGDRLSRHELALVCMEMAVAGYDTTAHQIASGAHLLLAHQDQLHAVRGDWDLLDRAVEEILRAEPAAPFLGPLVAAANRDPARFDRPDRFDVTVLRPPHLTFGIGNHRCLGEYLARLELQIAIARLFRAGLELDPLDLVPQWQPGFLFRGLKSLPVRVV